VPKPQKPKSNKLDLTLQEMIRMDELEFDSKIQAFFD